MWPEMAGAAGFPITHAIQSMKYGIPL
jgi:hypothetical protein